MFRAFAASRSRWSVWKVPGAVNESDFAEHLVISAARQQRDGSATAARRRRISSACGQTRASCRRDGLGLFTRTNMEFAPTGSRGYMIRAGGHAVCPYGKHDSDVYVCQRSLLPELVASPRGQPRIPPWRAAMMARDKSLPLSIQASNVIRKWPYLTPTPFHLPNCSRPSMTSRKQEWHAPCVNPDVSPGSFSASRCAHLTSRSDGGWTAMECPERRRSKKASGVRGAIDETSTNEARV